MNHIEEKPILFFSLPRHDGPYASTPWQLAKVLARTRRVFFADHPYTFLEMVIRWYRKPVRKRIAAYFRSAPVQQSGINILYLPFVWPVNFLPKGKLYNFFVRWNHWIVASRINRYFRRYGVEEFVYVNSFEFFYPALPKRIKAKTILNVYHCIDPIIKPFTAKHGRYLEKQTAHAADVIITTAPALQRKFSEPTFKRCYLVPNGVDTRHFTSATKVRHTRKISGKIFGYLGNIERRVDYELLLDVLLELPDWTLVMAGPFEKSYIPFNFLHHPQVVMMGAVAYEDAPAVMSDFDVAVIPFKHDEASSSIYPLKLFEYLATGKLVVTTNFNPEVLRPLEPVINVATTAGEFAKAIRVSYASDSEMARRTRISIASANSWAERAGTFSSIIENEIREKHVHSSENKRIAAA